MSEQSLVLLRLCLLALVYLVFLRVLRAVWVELRAEQGLTVSRVARGARFARGAKGAEATNRARGAASGEAPSGEAPSREAPSREAITRRSAQRASELLLVAPTALAGRKFLLSAETTLGRAPGCGVQIDDVRVSKLHARLFFDDGAWYLEDLGSTNGTQLDGEAVVGPTRIKRGARIQITEIEMVLT